MRKNILILVVSVVLLSLLSAEKNVSLWNNSSIHTNEINSPDFPISFNPDISFVGMITSFFTKFELDDLINHTALRSRFLSVITENIPDEIEIIEETDELDEVVIIEEAETPDEIDIVEEAEKLINETIYRIQIGAFNKPLSDKVFIGVDNIITFIGEDGLIRYMAGSFNDYEDALNYQDQMKKRGFDDCYIIVDNSDEISKYITSNSGTEIEKEVVDLSYDESAETNDIRKDSMVVIPDEIDEVIIEVAEEVVEKPVVKEVVEKPVVKAVFKEDSLPSDKDIIKQHPNIKENAKELILEALDKGDIIIADVFDLLNEYAGKNINKKKVKKFIKKKRR